MSDARQPEVDFFPILGRDFDQMFRQIDSVREKIRRNTNLLASRHIKREKDSLPVDVCLPKTSLLKRRTIIKVMGGGGEEFSSGRNFVRYQIPCTNFS